MAERIPQVQEFLALSGYDLDFSDKVQEFTMTPEGSQIQMIDRWEFTNVKRTLGIVITQEFAVFQTTAYVTFERFVAEMLVCMDAIVQAGSKPIVTRVGLRYTSAIFPTASKPLSFYLCERLLGVDSPYLKNPLIAYNTIAKTAHGRMLVRIMQNRDGMMVPSDIGHSNLLLQRPAPTDGSVITLLDFDHFREWQADSAPYQRLALNDLLWNLNNEIYDVFSTLITPAALEEWK